MGKHKNSAQHKVLIEFLTKYPDMCKGFVRGGDKADSDAKWAEVTSQLNSYGPPCKDVMAWKKVWTDWKTAIRKKVAKKRVIDGGRYLQTVVTPTEEKIALLCGFINKSDAIEGLSSFSLGLDTTSREFKTEQDAIDSLCDGSDSDPLLLSNSLDSFPQQEPVTLKVSDTPPHQHRSDALTEAPPSSKRKRYEVPDDMDNDDYNTRNDLMLRVANSLDALNDRLAAMQQIEEKKLNVHRELLSVFHIFVNNSACSKK